MNARREAALRENLPVLREVTESLRTVGYDVTRLSEVLVTVVGLPGHEKRWAEPVSRTVTFDPSLCSEIVNAATEP